MDVPSAIVLIVVAAAILAWVTSPRTGHALEGFGLGFIGYRGPGWPHGVQEEEPIHYSIHPPRDPDAPGPIEPGAAPEVVELDRPADISSIAVERPSRTR
jgi:hypothetical protein